MKALIIYHSHHHGNTKIIAKAIGGVLESKVVTSEEFNPCESGDFDVIGIGSGIYCGSFHKTVFSALEKCSLENKKILPNRIYVS